jgi:hypothetical protein
MCIQRENYRIIYPLAIYITQPWKITICNR